jgi:uncharacterized protein
MAQSSNERFLSMDVVRGFAVLGILLMNINLMGLPSYAYIDPSFYGGATGADLWTWLVNFAVTDGKMRGLFTMLFGASAVLIAARAAGARPGPVQTHYLRMAWLLLFGVANAYLIFAGDILVSYALTGLLIFPFRKLNPKLLIGLGAAVLLALLGFHVWQTAQLAELVRAAAAPGASAATVAELKATLAVVSAPPEAAAAWLDAYRGSFADVLKARHEILMVFWTVFLPSDWIPEAFGQMLIGMGLFRAGFFTLRWPTRAYLAVIAFGYLVAAPLNLWLGLRIIGSGFEVASLNTMMAWSALPRPFVALAHASVVLLAVRAFPANFLIRRFEAAGRMALTNYLASGIITGLIFNGYGFGLYGRLGRAELLWVVLLVWVVILAWSKPWMERFCYGPFEWLWRTAVRLKPQPFVRRTPQPAPA